MINTLGRIAKDYALEYQFNYLSPIEIFTHIVPVQVNRANDQI